MLLCGSGHGQKISLESIHLPGGNAGCLLVPKGNANQSSLKRHPRFDEKTLLNQWNLCSHPLAAWNLTKH
jgi:hypothetical protein